MLKAHHISLLSKKLNFSLANSFELLIEEQNFIFPKYFIFLAPKSSKYLEVSLLDEKHIENVSNNCFAKLFKIFHLLKLFSVILAFKRIKGIPFFLF